jgi:hypothetical protein
MKLRMLPDVTPKSVGEHVDVAEDHRPSRMS